MSLDRSTLDKKTNKDDIADVMNMIIVIDKEKLPEGIRKLIEEHIPKDMQRQLEMSQEQTNISHDQSKHTDAPIDNKLYAIQVGEVVGNIYAGKGNDINK